MPSPREELEARLSSMSPAELEQRRRTIVASANGSYESLSTEDLQELSFVVSTLRRRNAGPPKTARVAGTKAKPSIDDLLL